MIALLSLMSLGCTLTVTAAEPETEAVEQTVDAAVIAKVKKGEWLENYDEALAAAKKLKRPVVMDFTGSDWCGWCIKLDKEVFSQKAFIKYARKELVLLKLDFPRRKKISADLQKQNGKLAQEFGIRGFPTIVIIDSDGNKIAQTGYQFGGAKKYAEHLKDLLKNK